MKKDTAPAPKLFCTLRTDPTALIDVPMPCGTGACYACAVDTARGVKLACADGAWFEPAADATGGLHVDGDMLQAALERVHERLTPRVPGFVAGA